MPGHPPHIPELFLREVWRSQKFEHRHLHTSDGRRITIVTPGIPNDDAGPDFLSARIRIGTTLFCGDVEIHCDAASWHTHRHASDPHYNRVILHVVMTSDPLRPLARTASARQVPLLLLHPYLDPRVLAAWESVLLDAEVSRQRPLRCAGNVSGVSPTVVAGWLDHLASERLEFKIRRCEERLKQLVDEWNMTVREPFPRYYGRPEEIPEPTKDYTQRDFAGKGPWEQLLYEGVMEALGYAKNRIPFLALARSLRLTQLRQWTDGDVGAGMALLFGAAGLLPPSRRVPTKESRLYVRALRKQWRALRKSYRGECLHEADWLFFRLRPHNFPTARLASMAFLLNSLFDEDGLRRLIGILKDPALTVASRVKKLHALFSFTPDSFWQSHYHFFGRKNRRGIALGRERINDIVVNSILPVALVYARTFKDARLRANITELLGALPLLQENNVLRIFHRHLPAPGETLSSVSRQQGALQLYSLYCLQERCDECAVGRIAFMAPPGAAP